jgi:hypothetical protein
MYKTSGGQLCQKPIYFQIIEIKTTKANLRKKMLAHLDADKHYNITDRNLITFRQFDIF